MGLLGLLGFGCLGVINNCETNCLVLVLFNVGCLNILASSSFFKSKEIDKLTSFSFNMNGTLPIAPGSVPPCPGSIHTFIVYFLFFRVDFAKITQTNT
jgi:hypothetical protein